MSERVVPSGTSSTLTLAAVTLKRLGRGRALWLGAVIGALPIGFASVLHKSRPDSQTSSVLFVVAQLLLAVLPALFVAASVGEEIEERTATYLWSRPIPRWAVLAGKLVALVPIVAVIVVASWYATSKAGTEAAPTGRTCLALAAGAVAGCLVATGIATIAPKHGMALSILYMVFDMPLAAIPASIKNLSLTHHVRAMAGETVDGTVTTGAIGLAAISLVWMLLALRRIRRLET